MECRFKERVAGSNQSFKAEGKTRRLIAFPLMPSSACWNCSFICLELGKKINYNHGKKRKMDQVLAPEGMVVLSQHWVLSGA